MTGKLTLGFLRTLLTALNILYMAVSVVLIGVGIYYLVAIHIISPAVVVVACGAYLFLVSVEGLIAIMYHQKLTLFLYGMGMLVLCGIQLSMALISLNATNEWKANVAIQSWSSGYNSTKLATEQALGCCGYEDALTDGILCDLVPGCDFDPVKDRFECPTCEAAIRNNIDHAFDTLGGVGLALAVAELVAVPCAIKYFRMLSSVTVLE